MRLCVELTPDPEMGGFSACIPDIPAYGEGDSEEDAIGDLKEALKALIDAIGVDETLSYLRPPAVVRQLDLDFLELARG